MIAMKAAVGKHGLLHVDVIEAAPAWRSSVARLVEALQAAAAAENAAGEVSLLLSDDDEIAALNQRWRGKLGPTNVLSFPAPETASRPGARMLGDIALAAQTVALEAESQSKRFEDHAMHLVVHGLLHLLGYDHDGAEDAAIMEAREREVLARLGIADPYA